VGVRVVEGGGGGEGEGGGKGEGEGEGGGEGGGRGGGEGRGEVGGEGGGEGAVGGGVGWGVGWGREMGSVQWYPATARRVTLATGRPHSRRGAVRRSSLKKPATHMSNESESSNIHDTGFWEGVGEVT
jgi:hypothetical protein